MDPREARSSACRSTKNTRMRNTQVRELRTVWEREMCLIREMRENARNLKREMREGRDICEMRNVKCAINAKMRNARDVR